MTDGLVFPEHVRGWLTPEEGARLADLARGRRVLEIGAFEGRSTVCMAQTAERVDAVDPFDGRATPAAGETHYDLFDANLRAYGVRHKVTARRGTTAEVAPALEPASYDLVFVDGDHSAAALGVDVRAALRLVKPGGLVAFHDYQSPADPDVTAAVHDLLAGGAELVDVVGRLAVVRPGGQARGGKPVVFLAMPRRGGSVSFGASQAYHLYPTAGRCVVLRGYTAHSILDHCFNRLWCAALNARRHGVTHFAMLHDDVCPGQHWLDVLVGELDRTGADVCSAVVPIKTEHGATSTAVETGDPWFPRRLTLREVHALPATFADADAGGELLLNTGCWAADLRRDFWTEPAPLFFQTQSRLVRDDNGEWQAQVRSEDWEFSRAARARGARLCATRLVPLHHAGETEYPNDRPWGSWATDEVYAGRNGAAAAGATR